jgi:hypothetical protein
MSSTGVAPKTIDADPRLKFNPSTKYLDHDISKQQRIEAWTLSSALAIVIALTFLFLRLSNAWWSCIVLAGLGGIIGGLLHSLKWFYRTVGDGEWQWDRLWWRFLNPVVSGVMGFSIFIVFRSGIQKGTLSDSGGGKDALVAYSVGFLTGLFADNAMGKLRDIAYVFFGPTRPPASKPKTASDGLTQAENIDE